jgi:hypothetical protein
VIGERHGAHPELGRSIHQTVDPAAAVEQAVVGVNMEVDEIFVGCRQAAKAIRAGGVSKRFERLNSESIE